MDLAERSAGQQRDQRPTEYTHGQVRKAGSAGRDATQLGIIHQQYPPNAAPIRCIPMIQHSRAAGHDLCHDCDTVVAAGTSAPQARAGGAASYFGWHRPTGGGRQAGRRCRSRNLGDSRHGIVPSRM